jgi:demethylmenaquinone methyltransferase/2-methoxy-6-polyprenyl-1,4-benzoquinol methylase
MSTQTNPNSQYIQTMFDRLAARYDLFNHLTSMGLAVGWRRETLKFLKPGMRVLDLGCGTGDLVLEAIKKIGDSGEAVGLDFSQNMLSFAKKRYDKLNLNGRHRFRLVLKKAEELPIESEPYDLVVSGFVLRNLYENIDPILAGVYRSLKPGGRISFLDITESNNALVRMLWRFYMNTIVAFYGKLLFGKDYPAFYLTESAKRFLKSDDFVEKLKAKGFQDVHARPFMLGTVTLYQASKA